MKQGTISQQIYHMLKTTGLQVDLWIAKPLKRYAASAGSVNTR